MKRVRVDERETEAALQLRIAALNARLAAIVESSDDAIIGKDLEGIITSWNKGAERIYGYTAEEAAGRPISMLVPPTHADEMELILQRMRSGEHIEPFETVRIRKDGRQIMVSLVVSPVKDSRGTIIGASTIAQDITEHRRAEDIIRRQAQILNQIQDAVITTDLDGYITSWNKGAEKLYLYTAEEALGRHITLIYPEDERQFLWNGVIAPLKEKGEHRCELRLKRKSGEEFFALLLLSLLRGEDGAVVGMIGSSVDITELKQAEEKIQFSKEEWERTFDAMPDMVAVIDNQHVITRANEAMAVKMGIRREDLIGRSCYSVFHGTKEPPPYCPHHRATTQGVECFEEIFEESLNGHYVISATPLRTAGGAIRGIVHVWRDISKRKQMEEKLREAAVTDPLTGLFNRRGFFSLAEQQLRVAERKKRSMMLLYLDIDKMKEINDEYGHLEGDHALTDTATLLRRTFRESDIIARIGGDEFAILLTEPSGPDAESTVLRHLHHALDTHNRHGGRPYRLSLSVGTAYYYAERPGSLDDLLTVADTRMYVDKNRQERVSEAAEPREKERRLYERILVDSGWWAEVEGLGKAAIKDISAQGICLETRRGIDVHNRCGIMVHSPNEWDVPLEGVVIWSRPAHENKETIERGIQYEAGIRFIETGGGTNPLSGPAADIVRRAFSSRAA